LEIYLFADVSMPWKYLLCWRFGYLERYFFVEILEQDLLSSQTFRCHNIVSSPKHSFIGGSKISFFVEIHSIDDFKISSFIDTHCINDKKTFRHLVDFPKIWTHKLVTVMNLPTWLPRKNQPLQPNTSTIWVLRT